jgi:thiol:disulfide interchange protein DsbA
MNRRLFNTYLLGTLGTALLPAAGALELQEGRDWRPLSPPQPDADPARVEVLEFFSYGCPHCAEINPHIVSWAGNLPADVDFQRVPVTFGRAAWKALARLYYALYYDDALQRLDQVVFDAVTKQRANLYTERAILSWVADQGLDPEGFAKVLNSFAVETALARATDLAARLRVDAVPRIIVDGRYVVVGDAARDYKGLLDIADGLIAKARQTGAEAQHGPARVSDAV